MSEISKTQAGWQQSESTLGLEHYRLILYVRQGTVQIDFAVYLRWNDQSCINVSKADFGRTAEEYMQLWHPLVEVRAMYNFTFIRAAGSYTVTTARERDRESERQGA